MLMSGVFSLILYSISLCWTNGSRDRKVVESVLVGKHCARKARLSDIIHVIFYTASPTGVRDVSFGMKTWYVPFTCLIE